MRESELEHGREKLVGYGFCEKTVVRQLTVINSSDFRCLVGERGEWDVSEWLAGTGARAEGAKAEGGDGGARGVPVASSVRGEAGAGNGVAGGKVEGWGGWRYARGDLRSIRSKAEE